MNNATTCQLVEEGTKGPSLNRRDMSGIDIKCEAERRIKACVFNASIAFYEFESCCCSCCSWDTLEIDFSRWYI